MGWTTKVSLFRFQITCKYQNTAHPKMIYYPVMKKTLQRLHARLGDFWWYSLMLFCACRVADLLNAFVGLWLVPKYVNPTELGAVTPLTNFANFLAVPVAAFANTFRNELSRLSIGHEYGKLKSLMRGVFAVTAVFLFIAIIVTRFLLPTFLERIRIVEGSLGIIIIAASLVSAVAPIYSNALQALKKFKTQSMLSVIGAPVRLITMLIAIPFRALSGYFIGQASVPVFSIIATHFSCRKELSVTAEPYWTREITHRFAKLFAIFAMIGLVDGGYILVESTILRQRLPDLDSAGYYIATRFSEIAGFMSATLMTTIFPFTAEKAAAGKDVRPLLIKALLINGCFCLVIALPFIFFGKHILSVLPQGEQYMTYWWAIPWLIGIGFLNSIIGLYITVEFSANRFQFLKWYLPLDLAYPILLLLITGHGYFAGHIPGSWTEFLTKYNIYSLQAMLLWITAINVIRAIACLAASLPKKVDTNGK